MKSSKRSYKLYDNLALICLFGTFACVCLQVFVRFILHIPAPWTEELARYLLVGVTYIGAGIAARKGENLGAYFLRDRLKGRALGGFLVFNGIVCLFVEFMFISGAVSMIKLIYKNIALTMPISQAWMYAPLIIGNLMLIIVSFRDLLKGIEVLRTGNTEGFEQGSSSPFPMEGGVSRLC